MTIYFDMDGTLADFYGVENWLRDIKEENCRPYRIAKPLVDTERFKRIANFYSSLGINFGIISWTAKGGSKEYNKAVRLTKIEWLNKNFPNIFTEIHIVKYGTPKYQVCKDTGYLFDDEEKNRTSWKWTAYKETEIFTILKEV